ncbi:hypothetical protein JRC04_28355 [Mycolicibacterium sp. S2-37]|uniref:hypothetical protein n=1 Tax=Mycolicibacterium sp. S2-37 TaxID=2810297 RepID=UPI001A946B1C|nr:hypothetical protein [Mycolicibacterium sp. S2-37]MBO0681393.1 hypothetical protein [Mycolicibacterium sp. S2-37]
MSKRTEAKKARRRKRQTKRAPQWTPTDDDLTAVDAELTERGWEFDVDNSTDELATWFYPPSGFDPVDHDVESVTRIWLTADDVWHVILVGAGEDGIDYVFSAGELLDQLEAIEAYRLGHPAPRLG